MKEILIGIIPTFLLLCLFWTVLYYVDDEMPAPPEIIVRIGQIEFIVIGIAIALMLCYIVGGILLK